MRLGPDVVSNGRVRTVPAQRTIFDLGRKYHVVHIDLLRLPLHALKEFNLHFAPRVSTSYVLLTSQQGEVISMSSTAYILGHMYRLAPGSSVSSQPVSGMSLLTSFRVVLPAQRYFDATLVSSLSSTRPEPGFSFSNSTVENLS